MKKYCCLLANGIGDRMGILENYLNDHDPDECDFYWLRSRNHNNYNPHKFFDISLPLILTNTDFGQSVDVIKSNYDEKHVYYPKGHFKQVPPLFTKYFTFKKSVTQLVDDLEITSSIGIHLRSYENKRKYQDRELTRSDELNNILIKSATDIMTPDNRYFIASDSQYILNYFKSWEKVTIIPTKFDNRGYCDRGSEDAFYFDLCNLYALSQCKVIYKTYGGFSTLAAAWGGKELLKLADGFY